MQHEQTEAPDLPHHELACLQQGAGDAWIVVDLVRSRDAMAVRADWQVRALARVHRLRNPDMPDAEGAFRSATAANDRYGGVPSGACWAGLAGAGRQHPLPPPEDPDGAYSLPAPAPAPCAS